MGLSRRAGGQGCWGRLPLGAKRAGEWDIAWAESFNATLKNERVHRMVYRTKAEAKRGIVSWIELRYNQTRLHSSIGYRTPNEVEAEYWNMRQRA